MTATALRAAAFAVTVIARTGHRNPSWPMIITHTQTHTGQRRLYLGVKCSLECWIEPNDADSGWSFHLDAAVGGNSLTPEQTRAAAIHILLHLAQLVGVQPEGLQAVPFEVLASLHCANPFDARRTATPRRKSIDNGYMATPPRITRPQADFTARDHSGRRRSD
jgi:hypothetical protein